MRTIDKPKVATKLMTRSYIFFFLTSMCFLLLLISYCYHNHIILIKNNNNDKSVDSIRGVIQDFMKADREAVQPETLETKLKHFDWKFYLKHNPDLIYNGINTEERATEHFSNYGYLEERWSNQAERPSSLACLRVKGMVNIQKELFQQACEHYTKSLLSTEVSKVEATSTPSIPELVTQVRSRASSDAVVSSSSSVDSSITNGGPLTNVNVKSDDAIESRSLIAAIDDFLLRFYHSISELYSKPSETLQMKMKHFDWQFYLKHNPDLNDRDITTEEQAIEHYSKYGYLEERWSNEEESPSTYACLMAKGILSKSDWTQYCSERR